MTSDHKSHVTNTSYWRICMDPATHRLNISGFGILLYIGFLLKSPCPWSLMILFFSGVGPFNCAQTGHIENRATTMLSNDPDNGRTPTNTRHPFLKRGKMWIMLCKLHCLFNLTPLSSRVYRSFKRKIRYLGNRRNRNINEQQDKWKNTRDRQEEKIRNTAEGRLISNE